MLRVVLTNQAFRSFEKIGVPSVEARSECFPMSSVLDSLDDFVLVLRLGFLTFQFLLECLEWGDRLLATSGIGEA